MAGLIDLASTPKEIAKETAAPVPMNPSDYVPPKYPYGTAISLETEQLKKLNLDSECCVGDILHGAFLAQVTNINKRQLSDGTEECRIELQITHLKVEDEDTETAEEMRTSRGKRRYNAAEEAAEGE